MSESTYDCNTSYSSAEEAELPATEVSEPQCTVCTALNSIEHST